MCIPGLHLSLGIYDRIWCLLGGALTELDLELAKLKSGSATPTGSSTYNHFSSLLQKIAHKQLEVDTQSAYTLQVDEMITHATLMTPNVQISSMVKELQKGSETAHKTLKKMVSCFLY